MLRFVALPLVLLFAAPADPDPESAFREIVANLRKQDLPAVWEALAPEAQTLMGRGLRKKMGAKDDADMRELVKAWQAKVGTGADSPLQMLSKLKVTIDKVERKGKEAVLSVRTDTPGLPRSGLVVMVEHNGKWRLKDIKQPGAGNAEARSQKANGIAALATLRNLVSAQAQFQAVGVVDTNQDGTGEYGTLAEMAGVAVLRGSKNKMAPPVLTPLFGQSKNGRITRSGYHFRLYLPGKGGTAVNEKDPAAKIDGRLAEVVWCAYAWPVKAGTTGTHALFINQMGDVLTTPAGSYSGENEPSPYAAFPPTADGKPAKSITGDVMPGKKGSDGRTWKPGW